MKGRGSQIKIKNKFAKSEYTVVHQEGVDVPYLENLKTKFVPEHPKKIVNMVNSPYVPFSYSMNPYQGCEAWMCLLLCERKSPVLGLRRRTRF